MLRNSLVLTSKFANSPMLGQHLGNEARRLRVNAAMEVAPRSPADNGRQPPRKPTARSRVSNGRDVLPDIDGRSCIARRYRDIMSAILVDQGGADQCSESRKQLIRRFAAAAVLAEQLEARLANGEQIDIAEHSTLSSTLVRLAQRIGTNRVARDVVLPLRERWALEVEAEGEVAPDENEPTSAVLKAAVAPSDDDAAL